MATPNAKNLIGDVRLIDVEMKRIVLYQEGRNYAALSYLWGMPSDVGGPGRTIRDAMIATQNLGYR